LDIGAIAEYIEIRAWVATFLNVRCMGHQSCSHAQVRCPQIDPKPLTPPPLSPIWLRFFDFRARPKLTTDT